MSIKVLIAIISLLSQSLWLETATISNSDKKTADTPTSAVNRSTTVVNSKALRQAAKTNAKLRRKLIWEFAGTRQRGWSLYLPIISEMIGVSAPVNSPQFAAALASWQNHEGLSTTGILDKETWQRMVEQLQSNRLKTRDYPPEHELVIAPAEEFFDPTRAQELRQVQVEAYQAYKRMVAAALADKSIAAAIANSDNTEAKNYFKLISCWRSREYQEQLRQQQGNPSRITLAKNSPHFTGRALDIYVGGLPVSTENKNRAKQVASPAYHWLVRNAPRFGFRPYFYEPWHWEYVEGEGAGKPIDNVCPQTVDDK
ncbi:MAG: M15 family metallopeptidase [Acidobacteriota bacterium]